MQTVRIAKCQTTTVIDTEGVVRDVERGVPLTPALRGIVACESPHVGILACLNAHGNVDGLVLVVDGAAVAHQLERNGATAEADMVILAREWLGHPACVVPFGRSTVACRTMDVTHAILLPGTDWWIDPIGERFTKIPRIVRGIPLHGEVVVTPHTFDALPVDADLLTLIVAEDRTSVQEIASRVGGKQIAHGADLRDATMADLLKERLVLTCATFVRESRVYAQMRESAMGRQPYDRAHLAAWARQRNHREPLLEAVRWDRVVFVGSHGTWKWTRIFDASYRIAIVADETEAKKSATHVCVSDLDVSPFVEAALCKYRLRRTNA